MSDTDPFLAPPDGDCFSCRWLRISGNCGVLVNESARARPRVEVLEQIIEARSRMRTDPHFSCEHFAIADEKELARRMAQT